MPLMPPNLPRPFLSHVHTMAGGAGRRAVLVRSVNLAIIMVGLVAAAEPDVPIGTANLAAHADQPMDEPHLLPVIDGWSLHAQSTLAWQAHDDIRSPYAGPNSLSAGREAKHTWTVTAFLGRRLWEGAEIYANPEMSQGAGLSQSLGMAGFPNGEATRASSSDPHSYFARYFLRQTIRLGGDSDPIADDQNQIAGTAPNRRLVLTVGKVSATDFFDANIYSHDPRTQFLNWALMDTGAWDYPADARGYTDGVVAELIMPDWAFRVGGFREPEEANGLQLDHRLSRAHGDAAELELGYQVSGRPGKTRILGYINHAVAGNYPDAIARANSVPDVTRTRKDAVKYGWALNLEQELADGVGAFVRLGWNDGHTETWAFTEIDRSAAAGLAIKGASWSRPADVLGVAGLVNGLSQSHRDYLAAGGIGFIIGDGRLAYGSERILETYYAAQVVAAFTLSLDYQLVDNPGYNRDRGPVSILGVRGHVEF